MVAKVVIITATSNCVLGLNRTMAQTAKAPNNSAPSDRLITRMDVIYVAASPNQRGFTIASLFNP